MRNHIHGPDFLKSPPEPLPGFVTKLFTNPLQLFGSPAAADFDAVQELVGENEQPRNDETQKSRQNDHERALRFGFADGRARRV